MKGKTFGILLVTAVLLVGLALLRQGSDKPAGDAKMGAKLFADLPINQIASVTIADAESQVTMTRGAATWQVAERGGYTADFDKLRDIVVKLSRLKIGRSFSGTQETLSRLSLLSPTAEAEAGQGTAITLKDEGGKVLADVILGQVRQTDGGGSGGQYLKNASDDTVYLVDGNFRFLRTTPTEWLEKDVLNIKGEDVRSVFCYVDEAEAPVYRIVRPAKGEAAALSPIPEGRAVDTAKIDQLLDAMAPLTLDDVSAADTAAPSGGTRLVYQLFDGREITLYPHAGEDDTYTIRVSAAELPVSDDTTTAADEAESAKADETDAADTAAEASASDDAAEKAPVVRTAQEINDALGPWAFTVKKWQFESLITDPQKLLKELETKAENES